MQCILRRGVVGFFASSETGKSTLAFELAKRGHAQWSDDSLVFDTGCSDATVVQLPFRVRVRGSSEYGMAAHQHSAAESPGRLRCSFWSARSSQDASPPD